MRYRKPRFPTSPSFPYQVPGVAAALPPPAPAGTARPGGPHRLPAAVPARAPASCLSVGTVAGRSRASWNRRTPSTRLLRDCGTRLGDGLGGWTGEGGTPLLPLNQPTSRSPLPAMFGDKGVLDFVKRTPLFAVPYRAGTGIERKSNEAWTRECDMGQAEPGVPVCTVLEEKLLMLSNRRFIRIKSLYGLPPSFSFYGKGNMQKSDLPSQSFLMAKLETRNKIQSDGNEWRTMRRVKRFQHSRFSWCIARRLLEWGGKIY